MRLVRLASLLSAAACSRASAPAPSPPVAPPHDAAPAAPAVDPALMAPFDPPGSAPVRAPRTVRPMRGPFTDLDAYCLAFVRQTIAQGSPDGAAPPSCTPEVSGLSHGTARVTGPGSLFEARVFASNDGTGRGTLCRVAACSSRGWYVDADGAPCDAPMEGRELALRDIAPGPTREVVFHYASAQGEALEVCGLGASERPSCAQVPLEPARARRGVDAGGAVVPDSVPLVFP